MPEDLSLHHEPISAFLDSTPAGVAGKLSAQQVEQFHTDGFIAGLKVLSDEQVELLLGELADWMSPGYQPDSRWYEFHSNEAEDPDEVLFHSLGAWRSGASFHDLLWNPLIVAAAEQLLDAQVRMWHDQLFCKPAGHGGGVAWHQDYSYWTRTTPVCHLTCWIALDDTDETNGSIQYVRGSHRWPLLPMTGLAGEMTAIREVLDAEQCNAMANPVSVAIRRGECTFHHPMTVHGSHANRSNKPRRATVVNLAADGCQCASSEPLLSGIPPLAIGQPLSGQFFPLLSCSRH